MSNTMPTNFICPITYDIMKHPVLLVEDVRPRDFEQTNYL